MTGKQKKKAVSEYLVDEAKKAANEAQAVGATEEEKVYQINKSIIIRDLLKDLHNGK